mmetsp:Transcript_130615/g.325927  ORF Transcript_130615/g.325927 Transcript_130615/m.325927 type:complete len:319 (+) Transcript_130615:117-1073(+)
MATLCSLTRDLADLNTSLSKAQACAAPYSSWGRQLSDPVKVTDLMELPDSFLAGRQMSDPVCPERAAQVQLAPDLDEAHGPWRQMSDPVKVYTTRYAPKGFDKPPRGKKYEDAAEVDEDDVPTTSPSIGSGDESTHTSQFDLPCLSSSEAVPPPPGLPDGRGKDQYLPRWVGQHGLQQKPVKPKLPGTALKSSCAVTVSGLPETYSEQLLLEEFRDAGFSKVRDFDYFHLSPKGCCKLNFVSAGVMRAFVAAFEDRPMRHADTKMFMVKEEGVHVSNAEFVWQPAQAPSDPVCPGCLSLTQSGFNFCMQCGMCLKNLH